MGPFKGRNRKVYGCDTETEFTDLYGEPYLGLQGPVEVSPEETK